MCRATCPFAPALLGSIVGSASGATAGAICGWLSYAVYAAEGGRDFQGLAILVFGTLGMGIGGSGGAVGGLVEGWSLAGRQGPADASAARWGASLGALWGLQPILWLTFSTDLARAGKAVLAVAPAVVVLGAVSGLVGGVAARQVGRGLGLARTSAGPAGKRC